LIRSTDAAQTWTNVVLQWGGRLPRPAHRGASIYGWDATSGRLLVSGDRGKTWRGKAAGPVGLDETETLHASTAGGAT
ncbi:MAG: hypothetical protein ABJC62_06390, partial [Frankiaceae bacterium]